MGVFGLTIPRSTAVSAWARRAMCVVSEELSRGYIGVGSLGTRSEIAAELIIWAAGTDEQKAIGTCLKLAVGGNPADRGVHRTEYRVGPRAR